MRALWTEVSKQSVPMLFSTFCAILVAGFIAFVCVHLWDIFAALLAVAAGLLGWIVGILASPDDPVQEKRFGDLAKVISGFVTGYLFSKIDPLVGSLLIGPPGGHPAITEPQVAKYALIAVASFFDALVISFEGRIYWIGPDANLREWIAKQPDPKPNRPDAIRQLVKIAQSRSHSGRPAKKA